MVRFLTDNHRQGIIEQAHLRVMQKRREDLSTVMAVNSVKVAFD